MKNYTLSNWDANTTKKGLLFFAETAEEMLFHHSHDSFKVPTLNFKFLCYDILTTIQGIEEEKLDTGNLYPLIDELMISYQRDPIIKQLYGEKIDNIFDQKNEHGVYVNTFKDICKDRTSDTTRTRLRKTLYFLIEDMNNDDKYYKAILKSLSTLVNEDYDTSNSKEIYSLTQTLLSELINRGYSIEFLYNTVIEQFFSEQAISNVTVAFDSFINTFTFEKKKYAVYFPIPGSIKDDLVECFNLQIADNIFEMFNNQYPYVGKQIVSEMDPELARSYVTKIVEVFLSIVQYDKHNDRSFKIRYSDVVDVETKKCFYLKEPVPAILRGRRERERTISQNICPHRIKNLLNAISLHSSAMKSKDINNQFLSLWTAIEVLVPVERKGSFSRINQISNALSTVMSITYLRTLLSHLYDDLQVIKETYKSCIIDIDADPIFALACILSKPEYANRIAILTAALESYPILKYRLSKYEKLLKDPAQYKKYYDSHSQRIRQQTMRIYRTRNMIVHDGSHSVYIELIIQNLHFYLDTLIDTIYVSQKQGYENIHSIFKSMGEAEKKFISIFDETSFSDESLKLLCSVNNLY